MRKLTMPGFLSAYVKELAVTNSLNIHKLITAVYNGNHRLKEPLFLYCHFSGKSEVLMKYLNDSDKSEFSSVAEKINVDDLSSLPVNYAKVFEAYSFQNNKYNNEVRIKGLMVNKIIELQKQKKVTSYRVYTDLHINSGNYDSFVNKRNYSKLSLSKSREVLNYLERL